MHCGQTSYRTKTCTDGGTRPAFNERFTFGIGSAEHEVTVDIWNHNTLTRNNRIGTCKVPLAGAFARGYDDMRCPVMDSKGKGAGELNVIITFVAEQQQHLHLHQHQPVSVTLTTTGGGGYGVASATAPPQRWGGGPPNGGGGYGYGPGSSSGYGYYPAPAAMGYAAAAPPQQALQQALQGGYGNGAPAEGWYGAPPPHAQQQQQPTPFPPPYGSANYAYCAPAYGAPTPPPPYGAAPSVPAAAAAAGGLPPERKDQSIPNYTSQYQSIPRKENASDDGWFD